MPLNSTLGIRRMIYISCLYLNTVLSLLFLNCWAQLNSCFEVALWKTNFNQDFISLLEMSLFFIINNNLFFLPIYWCDIQLIRLFSISIAYDESLSELIKKEEENPNSPCYDILLVELVQRLNELSSLRIHRISYDNQIIFRLI